MRLRRYQRDGVRAMLKFTQKRSAVYLADEMGLGKTPQAIVYARVIRAKKVLVICPASVVLKWAREFKVWHRGRKIIIPILKPTDLKLAGAAEVVVCSYTRAAMDKVIGVLQRHEWDALILDESHYVKNSKAQRSQACLRHYWPRAKKQVCVSGTPLPNSVMDGFLLFNKILPEVFANRYKFGFRYTNAARNHFTGGWEFKGGRNMKELAHLVRKHFMVRRLQRDVLSELPEILFTKNYCRIADADQYKLSDEEQAAVLDAIAQGSSIMASEHIMTVKRGLGIAKVGAAWNQIDDLMRAGDMPRLVVFSYHREVIERLKELCAGKYRTLVLDGGVSSEKRDKIIQEFQGDNPIQRVLLAQITAAGIGIDLTAADTAVFVEFDWTPANISQAYKRLHRMGQERRVNIIYLIAEGTLDEQITASLLEKAKVTAQALKEDKDYDKKLA